MEFFNIDTRDIMGLERRRPPIASGPATCYVKDGNSSRAESGWSKCGLTNDCCVRGDECLPNHMCWSPPTVNNKVSYYPAACTESDFPDGKCNPGWCGNETQPALSRWDSGNQWTCCGKGNLGQPSCSGATGATYTGPLSRPEYDAITNPVHNLSTGAIIGIVIGGVAFLSVMAFLLWRCCCSRRARDRRARGKFVPLGSGREAPGDQVVWNSNIHEGHDLHEGPMGGYAAPPRPVASQEQDPSTPCKASDTDDNAK